MTSDTLVSKTRSLTLAATGLASLVCAIGLLVTGAGDSALSWLPGVIGAGAAVTIFVVALLAGPKAAVAASDELYQAQNARALRIGYWTALLMYPVFGVAIAKDWTTFGAAFPAMALLTAAAYLLPHVWLTGRT